MSLSEVLHAQNRLASQTLSPGNGINLVEKTQNFSDEVAANIEGLMRDKSLQAASLSWLTSTLAHRYSYNFTSLGRPIIQYPQDLVALQEIIWATRPELIIETGIAHGGSLILSASMLALLD